MFFRLYNNICGKHQSHFYLPIYRLTLFMRRNMNFYTDRREGRRERCRQRYIPKSICEGPGGRQCRSGIFYAFCVAGEKIIAECWRSSGHPTCYPVIFFLPSVTRPLFVLLSSLAFFLPVSSIQPVNNLKILSLLPLKVLLTLILSFFPSQNLLLHGFWNTIFSWFTLSYLTSFFFFSDIIPQILSSSPHSLCSQLFFPQF